MVFVVLGGMNKMRNVMIAATILYALPEALRFLADYRMLLYAIILIVMMLLNNSKGFSEFKKKLSPKGIFSAKKKEVTR